MHRTLELLQNPQVYLDEIDKLHHKFTATGQMHRQQQQVSFYQISLHRKAFARHLAHAISNQTYQFSPAQSSVIKIGHKLQSILVNSLSDRIVHGALFRVLSYEAESILSQSLCSYRQGQSCYTTADQLRHYIKQHRRQQPHRHVNLYVIKTDIKSYANSIPMHPTSPLWQTIQNLLKHIDPHNCVDPYLEQLIQNCVTPAYINQSGVLALNSKGLPYGSQICSLIYNLYLNELDHQLSTIPSLFYRRYCDDMIIFHADKDQAMKAYHLVKQKLKHKCLSINSHKTQLIYLTIPGKPCATHSEFIGQNAIDFLGFSIQATGNLRMKKKKTRAFMKDIHQRIQVAAQQAKWQSLEHRAEMVCKAVRIACYPNNLMASPKLIRFIELHDDRHQLVQLDLQIAQWSAEAITQIKGRSAFKTMPYKKLRQRWQLPSLCQIRNTGFL